MAIKKPIFFYQFKSDRFDTIFLFLYKKSAPSYAKLFGYAYIKALKQPITYFVNSGIEPEFSLN